MLLKKFQQPGFQNHPILILLVLFLLPAYLVAQNTSTDKKPSEINWQLSTTVSQVQFYYSLTECNGSKVVLLKFDNRNDHAVKVSWKEKFTTQIDVKKEGAAGLKEIVLPRGVTMPSGCNDNARRKNIITAYDVQPHYVAQIISFEYADIHVIKSK